MEYFNLENEKMAEKQRQVCRNGHDFYAVSHEYVCPECELSKTRGALDDIRTLVTGCVPLSVDGKFQEICRAVLWRSISGIDHDRPEWYRHSWEREVYEKEYTE